MSSFIRNVVNNKRKTGIPTLDKFINSVENGTTLLIKEDEYSYIHNYFLNIFLSEGIHEKEKNILAINKNTDIEIYDRSESQESSQLSKMYIAWRYSDLNSKSSDSIYSLSSRIEYTHDSLLKDDVTLDAILEKLKTTKNQRIAIYSLFAPNLKTDNTEKWLYDLKKAVRLNNHICMISIPTFLYENVNFDQFFDIVMSLDSNIFNNYLPNYKAIIHFEKITFLNRIRENDTDTFKFGIKFSKDKLVIEKIDIPPEDIVEPAKSCAQF